ncbi:DUF417 family protein [Prevotella sp. OH937_COT-195]|uniref:DUF417 family protein n=1 Tax=Prevotella sp. OH937_COT-195 TaxID=2491051 RepID=UPI000F655FBE|nr:DUF417 family protein [Prevotella sp. OH937_COT-195]RRD02654.1 DUF417 family protein [Prevotella sp. OH937_COT-195]
MNAGKQSFPFGGTIQIGNYITLLGFAAILICIGVFKFTQTDAAAIKPFTEYNLLFWGIYETLGIQTISYFTGIVEILMAFLILLSIKYHFQKQHTLLGVISILFATLGLLFSTIYMWLIKEGVITTDLFILKNIGYIGFGIVMFRILQNKNIPLILRNNKENMCLNTYVLKYRTWGI